MTQGSSEGIMKDFEVAFKEAEDNTFDRTGLPSSMIDSRWIALWACRWMARYIENKAKDWPNDDIICSEIRNLAKELESK